MSDNIRLRVICPECMGRAVVKTDGSVHHWNAFMDQEDEVMDDDHQAVLDLDNGSWEPRPNWCDHFHEDPREYDDSTPGISFEKGRRLWNNQPEIRNRFWTMLTDDYGDLCIVPGYHVVNRDAYLMSVEPWTDENAEYECVREYDGSEAAHEEATRYCASHGEEG